MGNDRTKVISRRSEVKKERVNMGVECLRQRVGGPLTVHTASRHVVHELFMIMLGDLLYTDVHATQTQADIPRQRFHRAPVIQRVRYFCF